MSRLYLCGPITGCSYGDCTDWRKFVAQNIEPDIVPISPMRGKDYLSGEDAIGLSYENSAIRCQRGITTRCRYDCERSNMMLANFLGAEKVSIGSCVEFGWADAFLTPVILVAELDNSHRKHPIMNQIAGYVVETLEEGIYIANLALSDRIARTSQ